MKKLLVSACLIGEKVRYDGRGAFVPDVYALKEHFELVLTCPEHEALKKAPRPRMEVVGNTIIDENGKDHTEKINVIIENTVRLCKYLGITGAVLKSKSPTCGNEEIYDGTFKGKLVPKQGLLVRALEANGIKVYNETQTQQLLIDYKFIKDPNAVEETPVEAMKEKRKDFSRDNNTRDNGERKPFVPRDGGDRKPYSRDSSREGGERRSFTPRDGERRSYGDRPRQDGDRKPYAPREGGDRKPYAPRDGDRKPYNRDGARGDGERRSFTPRDGERKPYNRDRAPREGERRSFDRPRQEGDRKPYTPREGERRSYGDRPREDGERRPYNRTPREGERRSYGDRPRQDGDRKPRTPREGGDRKPYIRQSGDGERRSYGGHSSGSGQRQSFGGHSSGDGERRSYNRDGRSGSTDRKPRTPRDSKPYKKD